MWHELITELELPYTREEIFEFFSKAENLEAITPHALNFKIITPLPIEMKEGALIDYQLRINGIPAKWRTEITEWNPPFAFTDSQLKGPYRDWIHRHSFDALSRETTLMRDHVRYRLPFYPFGQVAYPFVNAQVRQIFRHRNSVIPDILKKQITAGV